MKFVIIILKAKNVWRREEPDDCVWESVNALANQVFSGKMIASFWQSARV